MDENFIDLLNISSHCLFDGWLIVGKGKYAIGYANKSLSLIENFSNSVFKIIGKIPYQRTRKNAIEIEFSNKELMNNILKLVTKEKYFQEEFFAKLCKNKNYIKIVLEAFWDDEGMVGLSYGKNEITRKLRGRCLNKRLRKQLIIMHNLLGINAYEEYDKKGILITGKTAIKNFSEKINFRNGVKVVKINGQKPVWKGVEKSEVLRLLLNSYKKG